MGAAILLTFVSLVFFPYFEFKFLMVPEKVGGATPCYFNFLYDN